MPLVPLRHVWQIDAGRHVFVFVVIATEETLLAAHFIFLCCDTNLNSFLHHRHQLAAAGAKAIEGSGFDQSFDR